MTFINIERQAKYNEIEKCIEKSLERGLSEKIRKPMYISLDLLKIEEAIEELETLRKSRVVTIPTFELSFSIMKKQKQNLINSLTKIVQKRQEETTMRINRIAVQLTQQG
tara:strand:+ start:1948 stop:2277 length:330 start_codon:yes stop_codon:yes gene_type:complete